MRATLFAPLLLLATQSAMAADPISGEWIPQGGSSKVRIGACPGKTAEVCGVVSWLPAAKAKDLDDKNPDPALKKRLILGVATISNFKSVGAGKWASGTIYDPASGKTYKGKLSMNADGTLKVEGCIAFLCQGQTWKRA